MSVLHAIERSASTLICCYDSQLHTAEEEAKKKKKRSRSISWESSVLIWLVKPTF
jgi:hypothetical protein